MTALYIKPEYPIQNSTRKHGAIKVVDPCFNWIAASNKVWLRDSLSQEALLGGFGARTFTIFGTVMDKSMDRVLEIGPIP